jgi:HdeA/HdeB family
MKLTSGTPLIFTPCLTAFLLVVALLLPPRSSAVEVNLAAVSCAKYENEILASTLPGYSTDPINTVMWLFGYSVAKSGDHVMYGDSLSAFGFALDGACKANPASTLLEAVASAKSKRSNPMDLTQLDCTTFETRHSALNKSDPDSAKTLTMWLFGYSVGLAGGHILDADAMQKFDSGLNDYCTKHPQDNLFEALGAPNPAVPKH